jgi:hypothetical protein
MQPSEQYQIDKSTKDLIKLISENDGVANKNTSKEMTEFSKFELDTLIRFY